MTLRVIDEAFNRAEADVGEGVARLTRDRDDIDRTMPGYLGSGWTGVLQELVDDARILYTAAR